MLGGSTAGGLGANLVGRCVGRMEGGGVVGLRVGRLVGAVGFGVGAEVILR